MLVATADGAGGSNSFPQFDEHFPDGSSIVADGEAVTRTSNGFHDLQDTVVSQHSQAQSNVEGDPAAVMPAATNEAKSLSNAMYRRAVVSGGAISDYGKAVSDFNSKVRGWNSEINGAKDRDEAQELYQDLRPQFTTAEEALSEAAHDSRYLINNWDDDSVVRSMWEAGSLPMSAMAMFPKLELNPTDLTELPPDLAQMSPAELRDYALEHPDLAAALLPVLPTDVKQAIGEELASRGKDMTNSEEPIETSDLADYEELLSAYGEDDVVATSFLNELGPRGLLELNGKIATSATDDGNDTSDFKTRAGVLGDLQTALGGVLAAGTKNVVPSNQHRGPDKGGDDHVSAEWITQLTEAGRERIEIGGMGTPYVNGHEVYGYQLLGSLLGEGDHTPHFLNRVGSDMLWFEQSYAKENGGDLPWDQVWTDGWGGVEGGHDVVSAVNEGMRLDWSDGYGAKDSAGWDPMGGLMEGLADNPEASRQFFTDDTVYSDGQDPELTRVGYLLHDRDWPNDYAYEMGMRDTSHPTGLDDFGEALKSATIADGADERSVDIVEEIVSSTYDQMPSGEDASRFSEDDILDPRIRESLSHVMGHYMPSVQTGLDVNNPNPGVDTSDDSVFNDARFNTEGDERPTLLMMAELGKDDAGREILTAYNNAQTFDSMLREMDGVTDYHDISLDTESLVGVQVQGAIDFGAKTDAADDALSADARYNQNVDRGVTAATGLLKDTPYGKVPGVGSLVDLVGDAIADANHQDSRGELNAELGGIFAGNKDVHANLVRDAIWRSIPEDELPDGMDGTEDLNNLSDEDQAAYDSWVEESDWADKMGDVANRAKTDYGPAFRDAEDTLEPYGPGDGA